MKLLKKGSLEWWQVAILKVALISLGIAIGATWPYIFASYAVILLALAIILGVYIKIVWARE